MLNKTNNICAFFLLWIIIFIFNSCNSSKLRLPEDIPTIATILNTKGYEINGYKWKPGEKIEIIAIGKKTQYSSGDLASICKVKTINLLIFEKIDYLKLTKEEIETCSKIHSLRWDFRGTKLDKNSICELSTSNTKGNRPSFYFSNTNVNDHMLECISTIPLLKGIRFNKKPEITEDAICNLTNIAKEISTFGLSNVSFSKKALKCIFSLPNLKLLTLQNWSQVPESEIYEMVHEYEDRHGRKLDAIIDDPTSIDSTVWPKNNN